MYLFDLLLMFVSFLVLIVGVLVGLAFLTLLERKVLGYIQIRKGPNKVGFIGLLQPFSDAIKLFTKEQTLPYMSNFNIYYLSPCFSLFFSLFMWMVIPMLSVYLNFNLSLLFFLSVASLGVYSMMMAGWSSNSSYALLGSLRSVAQTISYEVSMAMILMSYIYLIMSMNMMSFFFYQEYIWFIYFTLPLALMWVVTVLAETNRTPFDFAEGESELVSGFNVEYSSGTFALIFLAEYSSILFMSMLMVILFLGSDLNSLLFLFKLVFMSFLFLWVRGTLPRFRYDKLMGLAWKSFLPNSLNLLFYFCCLKIFLWIWLL
uniref:NADH-ubiquinone oxidoreductase chain 1 n=1 Tax=Luprops yunnanus TaxID=2984368 RepID=A0A978B0I7_9CUCU|nr:NADH dehydrogenase subunit 1 [Luprops yunnanus]UYB79055.1 NADH dehydrogenase subunit 1 [Luprops yunnanus]